MPPTHLNGTALVIAVEVKIGRVAGVSKFAVHKTGAAVHGATVQLNSASSSLLIESFDVAIPRVGKETALDDQVAGAYRRARKPRRRSRCIVRTNRLEYRLKRGLQCRRRRGGEEITTTSERAAHSVVNTVARTGETGGTCAHVPPVTAVSSSLSSSWRQSSRPTVGQVILVCVSKSVRNGGTRKRVVH